MISLRSKITRKVLNYFFLNPEARHYIHEFARLLHVDPKNLHRKLKELEETGLLKSNFLGKQRYFYLNNDYSLLDEYKSIIRKTIGLEQLLADALEAVAGIDEAYIYGSYAKNTMDEFSDIDLILVGKHSPRQAKKKIMPIEQEIGRAINIVDFSIEEFNSRKKRDPFLEKVFSEQTIKITR